MTVSVSHVYTAENLSGANPTISVSDTPATGDVLVLIVGSSSANVAPTAISGCGATWTPVAGFRSGSQVLDAWVGTGANASGTVTLTAASGVRAIEVLMVSGASGSAIGVTVTGTNTQTTPQQYASSGQLVIGAGWADSAANAITTLTPATGWTEHDLAMNASAQYMGVVHRIPTAGISHTVSATRSTGTYVSQLVLGDISGNLVRTNQITNPNFETGLTGWAALESGITAATSTAQVKTGSQSVLVTNGNGSATNANYIYGGSATAGNANSYSIPVTQGQVVSGNLYARMSSGTVSNAQGVIYWQNSSGTVLSTSTGSATGIGTGSWTKLKVNGTAPANATQFGFGARANSLSASGGAVYYDAFVAEVSAGYATSNYGTEFDGATTDTADYQYDWTGTADASTSTETRLRRTNRMTNPAFETGTTGWTGSSATLSTSTSTFHSGAQALKATSTATSMTIQSPSVSITANRICTFSAWVYASVACTVNLYATASSIGPGAVSVPANTWTRLSAIGYNMQTDSATADVRLNVTGIASGDILYVDDVLFEQGVALQPYFDGATTATGKTYAWTGTANASTSTETPATSNTIDSQLSGSGTLASALVAQIDSQLSGSGTLTSDLVAHIDSQLSGSGTLTSVLGRFIDSQLSGSGTLTSVLVPHIDSQLSGSGTMTSALGTQIASNLSGSGSLVSVLGREIHSALSGSGTLTSSLDYTPGVEPEAIDAGPLRKLVSFSVSASAVPVNPAEGSGATPSVSATYIRGTNPEYALGMDNTLINGAIGTYEGEIVRLALPSSSDLMNISTNTPLTLLNTEMHLFPFIDGVPGTWTAARAIEYWTQQCGLFYDKVPGECVAYASGFGHTDSYGFDINGQRFYEKPTTLATTQVINDRSVRTFGASYTGTTALHEVKDGSVLVSAPASKKLVFSIGIGLRGTGRTATAKWTFIDNAKVIHTVSLAATSAGAITAKLGATTVGSTTVDPDGNYRLVLSLERLSSTSMSGKLSVLTDDLAGTGMQIYSGAGTVLTYTLPGVLNLTSIDHIASGGSGTQMVRWGTYLTVAETHPTELPAVQKVLEQTTKPNEFVSGFEGNVWSLLNEYCAITRLDVRFLDGALRVLPRTTALSLPGRNYSRFEVTSERREKFKQVAVKNKQSKAVATDDAVLWRADSVFQVAAREVFETTVQTEHSILNLVQPVAVLGIEPFPYTTGGGQYVVTGADGYIIAPEWWADNGGKVEVSLTGKEGEVAIKITAPAIDTVRAPYRISEGAADRPALYVAGSGILNDPKEVHVSTGARNAREGFDSLFESPFIAGIRETYDTALAMAARYSASAAEVDFEVPNDFDTPTGFGQFPPGTLTTDNARNYRIMETSQTQSKVSGTAVPHTTIGAYVASYPAGATVAAETARHAGKSIRKFNIKPLRGDQ